jgi:hypothetical protein
MGVVMGGVQTLLPDPLTTTINRPPGIPLGREPSAFITIRHLSSTEVKSNASSSLKYVTSDEDTLSSDNYESSDDDNTLPSEFVKNPNAMIKGLMK